MSDIPMIRCPVCGAALKVTTSTSKRGHVALVLVCSVSGKDFRGFINNATFVKKVLDSLGVSPVAKATGDGETRLGAEVG